MKKILSVLFTLAMIVSLQGCFGNKDKEEAVKDSGEVVEETQVPSETEKVEQKEVTPVEVAEEEVITIDQNKDSKKDKQDKNTDTDSEEDEIQIVIH
ncbi:MAG: hypothetical protein KBT48_11835 [Firmicutes bacterium]|nr:hypothetical protein [Bacillota bacterium]